MPVTFFLKCGGFEFLCSLGLAGCTVGNTLMQIGQGLQLLLRTTELPGKVFAYVKVQRVTDIVLGPTINSLTLNPKP